MCECDIPSLGVFIREVITDKQGKQQTNIYFNPSQVMVEEGKLIKSYIKKYDPNRKENEKQILRGELNLGRCAEVCNTSPRFCRKKFCSFLVKSIEIVIHGFKTNSIKYNIKGWQPSIISKIFVLSQTRKVSSKGANNISLLESDPYQILNYALDKNQQQNTSAVTTMNKTLNGLPFISQNLGNFQSNHDIIGAHRIQKEARQDQILQMQHKKQINQLFSQTDKQIENEKNIEQLKLQEQYDLEERQRILQQRSQLRKSLIDQKEQKKLEQSMERDQNKKFEYQFPFHEMPQGHTRSKTLNKTFNITQRDIESNLPLQHGIQEVQHAYRLLKDSHRQVTDKEASQRVVINLDQLRLQKLREKELFQQKLKEGRTQYEITEQAKRSNLHQTQEVLKQQIKANQQMRQQQKYFDKSYTSGIQWMDSPDQKNTFNNFGPNENPERLEFHNLKEKMDKDFIREQLRQQIRDNELKRKAQNSDMMNYGKQLNELAIGMNEKERERQKAKKDIQFNTLKKAWEEQRKQKEELNKIENIFK
eukprot:403356088